MISKLLKHDRPLWVWATILYALLGLTVILFAGPLTWGHRALHGGTAGSAGVSIGLVSGVLLLGAALSFTCARRTTGLVMPIAATATGLAATALGMVAITPFWWGLAGVVPALVAGAGIAATHRVFQYQKEIAEDSKKPLRQRKHEAVDISRAGNPVKPDLLLTLGGGALTTALGLLGVIAVSTMTTLFTPALPDGLQGDGQVAVGSGNEVQVEILYGTNYPHSAQLLGDEDSTLASLVDDGTIELKLQGVSLASETRLSVPVREGEACAWEQGGADGAFAYITKYNQQLGSASQDSDAEEMALDAGEDLGAEFTECFQSGKYELQAGRALEQSTQYADQGLPQIYINGSAVQPESLSDLKKMIQEAA